MTKKGRVYWPRIVGNRIMTSAGLERLHKELLEFERIIAVVSDERRALIEEKWPELVHKLP